VNTITTEPMGLDICNVQAQLILERNSIKYAICTHQHCYLSQKSKDINAGEQVKLMS